MGFLCSRIVEREDFFMAEFRQVPQTLSGIGVGQIDPVLKKEIRRCTSRREPNLGAGFRFTDLFAFAVQQQWTRDAVQLHSAHAPREINSRSDVSPLVTATSLQLAPETVM